MLTRYLKLVACGLLSGLATQLAVAQVDPSRGTWTTTLQARDLNGDHEVDAYYDSSLHVTWLADANFAGTSGFVPGGGDPYYSPAGGMTYETANSWVSSLDYHGVTGWRLPDATFTASAADPGCSIFFVFPPAGCNYQPDPETNELAHLFFVTLGNSAESGLANVGHFDNVAGPSSSMLYFAGAPVELGGWTNYSTFSLRDGQAVVNPDNSVPAFAWVVRDGDVGVAPVPEPGTYALMLGGLLALVGITRRRRRDA